jgi:hypothetical protein
VYCSSTVKRNWQRIRKKLHAHHLVMPTTALLRRNAVSSIKRIAYTEPLLPFLYNTRTIRCEHTDALSEFDNTPSSTNDRQRKPRPRSDRDGSRPTFRDSEREAGGYERTNRVRRIENPRFSRHDSAEEGSETFTPTSTTQYRRPMREDDIPFEHAAQETMSIRDQIVTSTMTPSERKAFEGLLSLSPNKAVKDKGRHRDRQDKLDDVLAKATTQRKRKQDASHAAPMPEALQRMQDKLKQDRNSAERVLLEQAVEQDLLQVKKTLATAESDVELWKMMHDIILSRLAPLDLENPVPKQPSRPQKRKAGSAKDSDKTTSQWQGNISDELVITQTLPQHLGECARVLFYDFPASHLHISLLPYLKSLGPATFALAASTRLYNLHMRALFRSHTNLLQISRTLQEMDVEVYDFDDKTRDLVSTIAKRGSLARKGIFGPGIGALWNGERFRKATKATAYWGHTIETRMQEKALREARAKEGDEQHTGIGVYMDS